MNKLEIIKQGYTYIRPITGWYYDPHYAVARYGGVFPGIKEQNFSLYAKPCGSAFFFAVENDKGDVFFLDPKHGVLSSIYCSRYSERKIDFEYWYTYTELDENDHVGWRKNHIYYFQELPIPY